MSLCLVLTNTTDDDHTNPVIKAIEERGTAVFRFDVDRMATGDASVEIKLDSDGFTTLFQQSGQECNTVDVTSVWYRRPNLFGLDIRDPGQREFATLEMKAMLDGLWLTLRDRRWLNTPWAMQLAKLKVEQLRLAVQFGMKVPTTRITNNPQAVTDFMHDGAQIIYKTLSQPQIERAGDLLNVPTSLITERQLAQIDLIRQSPGIFQPFLRKAYEVRVTIVGESIFAAKLWNPQAPAAVVDWRPPQEFRELRHERIELPQAVASFIRHLMVHYGLQYATVDFVVDIDDSYTFLELNPNGQWLWIEKYLNYPISPSIAALLA